MKRNAGLPLTFLPDELIREILLRLPVRLVVRFKCVCKSWFSLISDPQFGKSHFDLAAAPSHRVLKLINNFKVKCIDVDNDDSADVVFNVPLFLPPHAGLKYLSIAGSCRGFILLELVSDLDSVDLVVWNPSTGLHSLINGANLLDDDNSHLCGIGYDSSKDDYVVVVVTMRSPYSMVVEWFSLRTNSWSFTEMHKVEYFHHFGFNPGDFLNGALYWSSHYYVDGLHFSSIIVAFDATEKTLSEIPLPAESEGDDMYHLSTMEGCLCFCENGVREYQVWIMKEYKLQSSWTKLFVLSIYNPVMPCLFRPICFFTENKEIMGFDFNGKLLRINGKGELFEHRPHAEYTRRSGLHVTQSLLSLPLCDFQI